LFVKRVRDRKAATLCPIIFQTIPESETTVVHTDEFSSYKKLSNHYFHYSCNHSKADYAHEDKLPEALGGGPITV
jgi:hypothetical protein